MTDLALPVTEQAVSRFVTDYPESLGATINKDERRWTISMPANPATELSFDDTVVNLAADPAEVDDDTVALAPGSDLFERIVDDAVNREPLGSATLTGDDVEFDSPNWVASDSVEVTNQQFTPYYDRNALCVLFHVGVETVSEYQREMIRPGAVDLTDHEQRPQLAHSYLELTEQSGSALSGGSCEPSDSEFTEALTACREMVTTKLDPEIQEIREKATRTATAEIEEYRQYLQQRQEELKNEKQKLAEQIDELSKATESTSERTERLKRLRKRKELRSDLTDLRDELDEVRDRLNRGMPKKCTAVRDRHALTVRVRPVTSTVITYERGDMEFSIQTDSRSATLTCDYAVGIGTLSQPTCEQCGTALDSQNLAVISNSVVTGQQCCGG